MNIKKHHQKLPMSVYIILYAVLVSNLFVTYLIINGTVQVAAL